MFTNIVRLSLNKPHLHYAHVQGTYLPGIFSILSLIKTKPVHNQNQFSRRHYTQPKQRVLDKLVELRPSQQRLGKRHKIRSYIPKVKPPVASPFRRCGWTSSVFRRTKRDLSDDATRHLPESSLSKWQFRVSGRTFQRIRSRDFHSV